MSRLVWITLLLLFLYALMFARMSQRTESTARVLFGPGGPTADDVDSGESSTSRTIDRVVESERVFHGRVTDEYGYPLYGVEVSLDGDHAERIAQTDESGEFHLSLASFSPGADHAVHFRKPGWASLGSTLSALDAQAQVRLRPSRLRGRVLDPDSQPVHHARIITLGADDWWAETTSDANGLFVCDPPPGPVTVTARSQHFVDTHVRGIQVVSDEYTDVVVELSYDVVLRTRFIDDQGQTLPGVAVTVTPAAGHSEPAVTDSHGLALFHELGADVVTLVAICPGSAELIERFVPPAGSGEERRTFRLEPASPWQLEMSLPTDMQPEAVELTIARGGLVLYQGPAPNREAAQILGAGRDYLFTFRAEGCPLVRRRWRPPTDGQGVLTVALSRGSRARGVVLDPLGRPIGGATVAFHPLPESVAPRSPWDPQTSTDDHGQFEAFLAGGSYRVQIGWPDGAELWRDIRLSEAEEINLGPLVVRRSSPHPRTSGTGH